MLLDFQSRSLLKLLLLELYSVRLVSPSFTALLLDLLLMTAASEFGHMDSGLALIFFTVMFKSHLDQEYTMNEKHKD